MKPIKILFIVGCLFIASLVSFAFFNAKQKAAIKTANNYNDDKGFAVVELFTSEGCSSCPKADELAAHIQKESAGKPVYILAFHVDYWNRLGWKDNFSSADYTHRQSDYARWLKLSSVYTPQMVVNGKTEFVGSQEGTLRNAIRAGLQKQPKAGLLLGNITTGNHRVFIPYTAEGKSGTISLMIALVQKAAVSKIASGENGGRTLSHVQIVRKIESILLNKNNGTADIPLPGNFDAQGYEIIAFLQNASNGEITAATRAVFPADMTAGL